VIGAASRLCSILPTLWQLDHMITIAIALMVHSRISGLLSKPRRRSQTRLVKEKKKAKEKGRDEI